MLTADGTVTVVDFAIACHLDGRRPALTTAGSVIGAPAQTEPEQADGDRTIGAPADVQALGWPPFLGDAAAVLHRHVTATPVAPSALRLGIPYGPEVLVLELLAEAAGERPPSVEIVASRLRSLSHDWLRRRPIVLAIRVATVTTARRRAGDSGTTRSARPARAVGAGTILTGAASAGAFALVGRLSGLSTPWPLALTAALLVVLAVVLTLFTRPRAGRDGPEKSDASLVGPVVILPIGMLACRTATTQRRRIRPLCGRVLRLPWRSGAEDTRFELVRGCPQHAFHLFVRPSGGGRVRPDLRRSGSLARVRTPPYEGECNQNCDQSGRCSACSGAVPGAGRRRMLVRERARFVHEAAWRSRVELGLVPLLPEAVGGRGSGPCVHAPWGCRYGAVR